MLYRQAKYAQPDPPGFDDDPGYWDQLLIEWARRGELPAAIQKAWVAPILEDYLYPATRGKRRKHRRAIIHQCRAQLLCHEIKRMAAEQDIRMYEAKLQVIKKYRLHSVEALERYIRRGKRRTKT